MHPGGRDGGSSTAIENCTHLGRGSRGTGSPVCSPSWVAADQQQRRVGEHAKVAGQSALIKTEQKTQQAMLKSGVGGIGEAIRAHCASSPTAFIFCAN